MKRSVVTGLLCVVFLAGSAAAHDPFQVTTPGAPGAGGLVPALSGFGTGLPVSSDALLLGQAAPDSGVTLVVGLSELGAPFLGGVLGPSVDILLPGHVSDGQGALALPFALHGDIPVGTTLWVQGWIDDPAALGGLSASNTIRFSVQEAPAPLYVAGSAISTATGDGPATLAVGDFDEDGAPDVAVDLVGEGVVVLLRGQGDGTLAAAPLGSVPGAGGGFAAGDLDGDGHLDLAITSTHGDTVTVWFGLGDGTFGDSDTYATGHLPVEIQAADVNGDGALDLLTADAAGTVSVLRNRGGGTYYPAVSFTVGFNPASVAAGDLDGDGTSDLAVSFGGSFGRVALLFGDGSGSFSEPEVLLAGALPSQVVIGDFDGNGDLDIAVCHTSTHDVVVFLGAGGGEFATGTSYPIGLGTQPEQLAAADLDGDGALDLVTSHLSGLAVLRGTGNGAFFPAQALALAGLPKFGLAVADLDGDDAPDLVTARLIGDEIVVLLQP